MQFSKNSLVKGRFMSKKPPVKQTHSKPTEENITVTNPVSKSTVASKVDENLEKMITSVLDLFPDLEKSFVKVTF